MTENDNIAITQQEKTALDFLKKKCNIHRFGIDCIGRVEVWYEDGLDIINSLVKYKFNNISIAVDASFRLDNYPKCLEKMNIQEMEFVAFKTIMRIAQLRDLYFQNKSCWTNTSIVCKGTTIEQLLIEKDLMQ